MGGLERIEAARGGPFTYRVNGSVRGLPSPDSLSPQGILELLEHGLLFDGVPTWKCDLLVAAWSAHYDLPAYQQARRLAYLVDRYTDELEVDLRIYGGDDLGELFRARRWRYLLNRIDRLSNGYYLEAVSNDEEHADMIAKAEAERRDDDKPWSPPLRTWTTEVDMLAQAVDAINALKYVTIAINSEKGKSPRPPDPIKRPETAMSNARKRAVYHRKLAAHNSLSARMLPHKHGKVDPKPAPSSGTEFLRRKAGLTH